MQLLISANDVENYKQIKADLDDLRNIVEKSELWVYKDRADDDAADLEKKVSCCTLLLLLLQIVIILLLWVVGYPKCMCIVIFQSDYMVS